MVHGRRHAQLARQIVLNLQSVLDSRRVNDSGSFEGIGSFEERREDPELIGFLVGLSRLVDKLWSIEPANDRFDLIDAELMENVLSDRRSGRRGQGKHCRMAEPRD